MSRFNFIPDIVIQKRHVREVHQWLIGGASLLAVILVVGIGGILFRVSSVNSLIDSGKKALTKSQSINATVLAVEAKITKLQLKNKTIEELQEQLPPRAVISFVVSKMSEKIALTKLSWKTPQLKTKISKTSRKTKPKHKKTVAKSNPASELVISGIAKSDVDAARFVSKLSNHKLFDVVKLVNSREVEINKAKLFEFHITATVFTNRDFLASAKTE